MSDQTTNSTMIETVTEQINTGDTTMNKTLTAQIALAQPPADHIAVITEIAALTRLINDMSPEAKQLAVKMGLIQRSQVQGTPRQTSERTTNKTKTPRITELHACACGCGQQTQSAFRPGHDATAKGRMIRAISGKMTQDELSWRPNAELRTYVATHPEWQARFGTWIATMTETVTADAAAE